MNTGKTVLESGQWQTLPLSEKLRITQERIRSYAKEFEDGVYTLPQKWISDDKED